MSFTKAVDLLRLAEMATSRHSGVGLTDIEEEFGVDRRTAQRMTRVLEEVFDTCTTRTDDERRKLLADCNIFRFKQGHWAQFTIICKYRVSTGKLQ